MTATLRPMRNEFLFDSRATLPVVGRDTSLHLFARLCILATFCLLSSCSSNAPSGGTYVVKRGDTLSAIAQRHRLNYRDIARWNGIGRDYMIHPGQVLRLSPGARASVAASRPAVQPPKASPPRAAPSIPWQWPVDGGVAKLTERPSGGHGLTISGRIGQEVRAASGGRVVYLGSGLLGYGQLLIIKHSDAYLSAYGHTQLLAVKEGDVVVMGQPIATMGAGTLGAPMLYFEIRVNGQPSNPLTYLPMR
ncbi:MAG TPA: peptidoglycan DD-metalloendopeptidase family protein [Steroidobacteraceae bacterium]|nr:peptidoglycan DD-metalloendopeptidase family protein [Steroidobacteraceae bacterium]